MAAENAFAPASAEGRQLQRRVELELLFAAHAATVRAYARRRADPAGADDVVSEVFVIAWRRLEELPDDPLPWLLACARRVLANQRRGDRRQQALAQRLATQTPSAAPGADAALRGGCEHDALVGALRRLSERDRELLMLIAWEGLQPERAAAVLGCSRGALAVRLHRARRRLAAALARSEERPVDLPRPLEVSS